ncbi:MAG: hypothetical protein WC812_02930 [Candidatus Pacearchaeota archaeon]|jgi:hypothetical protein
MAKINDDKLENALNKEKTEQPRMSKEMEIGFHQGAVTTLVNERNEFIKIVGNVDAIISAHLKRLEELGVKINKQ